MDLNISHAFCREKQKKEVKVAAAKAVERKAMDKALKSSAAFFSQLQDEKDTSSKAKGGQGGKDNKKAKKKKVEKSGASFKL